MFDDNAAPYSQNMTENAIFDVVIVESGWAGVSAARVLKEKGITNFQILEGRNVAGGRSRTIIQNFGGEDVPVDLGSQWIHGMTGNPLIDIMMSNSLPYATSVGLQTFFRDNNGGAFTYDEILKFESQLYSGQNGFLTYQADKQESTWNDQSLRKTSNDFVTSSNISSYRQKVIEMFHNTFI